MDHNPVNLVREFQETCVYAGQLPESVRYVEFLDESFLQGLEHLEKKKEHGIDIRVTGNDSFQEAHMMIEEGFADILVLNFANAQTPGGGVTRGALAQEECLCRQSSLYLSLVSGGARPFYQRGQNDVYHSEEFGDIPDIYSDCILYSPEVCVFKNAELEKITPFFVSVVTSAAPIRLSGFWGGISGKKKEFYQSSEYEDILRKRIFSVLAAAEHFGHKNLVLGAFGCGAFANEPSDVARLFRECLSFYEFEQVRFAVLPSGRTGKRNLETFQDVFRGK